MVKQLSKAAKKAAATVASALLGAPKKPFDAFGNDLARRNAINARSAQRSSSWLGAGADWLHARRRHDAEPRTWHWGGQEVGREMTQQEVDEWRAEQQSAPPSRGWLDRGPRERW
jgi:hypothetical protein